MDITEFLVRWFDAHPIHKLMAASAQAQSELKQIHAEIMALAEDEMAARILADD